MKMILRNGNFIKLIFYSLLFFVSICWSGSIAEKIENDKVKIVKVNNIEIVISKSLSFSVKKDNIRLIDGIFWLLQGVKKDRDKIKFIHQGWQFSTKKECEEKKSEKFKIDDMKEKPTGFSEEMKIAGKTIKIKYKFKINNSTDFPSNLYVNFFFNPEIMDKNLKPYIDEEKAVYETKNGVVIISYQSPFKPDRFNINLWKYFRCYVRFPHGLKEGKEIEGNFSIKLP